jgi:hypothetical protein
MLLLAFDEPPLEQLVAASIDARAYIALAAPVDERDVDAVVVLERADADTSTLETENRLRLTDLAARMRQARVEALADEVVRLRALVPDEQLDDASRRELQVLREEIGELQIDQVRLREIEHSTSYRIGHLIVTALAKPGKQTLRAPRELARLWRSRSERVVGRSTPGSLADARRRPRASVRTQRLLNPHPLPLDADLGGVLTIAGVWPAETERVLAPDAQVATLHPNQAQHQLELAGADVLLVQSSAALAGSPWAGLGTPVGVARDLELRAVLYEAIRRDVRTVLWFDQPRTLVPGLDELAPHFDVVLTDHGPWTDTDARDAFSIGVQLARFGVVDTSLAAAVPGFLGALDPRGRPRDRAQLTALLRAATSRGLRWFDDGSNDHVPGVPAAIPDELRHAYAGYLQPNLRPATYRAHAAWIATPGADGLSRRAAEQLASGARVVVPAPVAVDGELKPRVIDGSTAAGAATAIAAALDGPADHAQLAVLRELYTRAATHEWITRLARLLDVGVDPAAALATTLIAPGVRPDTTSAIVASVLAQRVRPAAVVAGTAPGVTGAEIAAALQPLASVGVTVHVVDGDVDRDVERKRVAPLLASVGTPWCAVIGPERLGPDHLLDLHVLRACSTTGVVGIGANTRVDARRALVRTDLVRNGSVTFVEGGGGTWVGAPGAVAAYEPAVLGGGL